MPTIASLPAPGDSCLPPPESPGAAERVRTLRRWAMLLCMAASLVHPARLPAAEGYTLVLKDGRRVDITAYETAGDWVYYYRYDARIGIPRDKIEAIVEHPSSPEPASLEDEILGRIADAHKRRFRLDDFKREDYVATEIAPLMSPEEQQAYVRKLLQLKKMEIFEIDDQRQAAEKQGDVVELAQLEEKLIRALADWIQGRKTLARMIRGPTAVDPPIPPEDGKASAADAAASGAEASTATETATAGLEKLRYRRETLRLLVKKHYQVDPHKGGFHTRRQAEEELRIVELQIRYFDRLTATPSAGSTAAQRLTDAPAASTD